MDTRYKQPVDAEETCKLLEQADLKYFPLPIENTDGTDNAGTIEPGRSPETPPSTVLGAVRRSLSFLCLPHPF